MVPSVFAWKCGIPPNGNFTREHVDTLRDFLGTVPWGTQFHLNHYVYKFTREFEHIVDKDVLKG